MQSDTNMGQELSGVRVGILEDNATDADHLVELLRRWGAERGFCVTIDSHSSASDFLDAAEQDPYALALLDCYLDSPDASDASGICTGMDVARVLRGREGSNAGRVADGGCAIFFTTSSMDFVLEGYEVNAAAYLIKPVEYEALAAALDRAVASPCSPDESDIKLSLKTADGTFQLAARNLVWARSRGHYIDFTLRDATTLRCRMPMHELVGNLAGDSRFYSPARGYLVNLDHVSGIQDFDFVLASGERVPISQTTLSAARSAYAARTFERMDALT